MIKLSEATSIALHSMIYITNRENECVSLKEIAKKFKISENHLSKVLQRLVKAGFIESIKGPKGGFKIRSNKKNLSFMKIYETIEGKIQKQDCLFLGNSTSCSDCIMGNVIHKINDEFIDYMKTHKISDFVL